MAMSETASRANLDHIKRRQTLVIGWLLLALAVVVAAVFGLQSSGDATFGLALPGDMFTLPSLVVPAAPYNYAIAAVLAFFGFRQFMRGAARRSSIFLGIGLLLAVTTFLVWATAGKQFSLTGMLEATVVRAVPIALGGLVGTLCERVAVVNIGIEGMLLSGAFTGAIVGSLLGGWPGLVAAIAVGGLISYVTSQVLTVHRELNNAPIFGGIDIPLLSNLPIIGRVFFQQNLFVYGAAILIAGATYYLFHTRSGLRARAVGEHPEAADTLGIDVYRTRYINVTIGGMVAGFALGSVGRFDINMTNGRGFIGLAAMIFGRWHPVGALLAALVFGFADSLQQKLAILQTPIPSEFLAMAPYIATIVLVAGLVGRARPPAADGKPYIKE